MNSKQRRQLRRSKLEKTVKKNFIEPSHTVEEMNDFCPNMYECKGAEYEWKCFGRYESCVRYQTGDLNRKVYKD